MEYVSTDFGVDSSSRFSFRMRTHTDNVTDAADQSSHTSATAGVQLITTTTFWKSLFTVNGSKQQKIYKNRK